MITTTDLSEKILDRLSPHKPGFIRQLAVRHIFSSSYSVFTPGCSQVLNHQKWHLLIAIEDFLHKDSRQLEELLLSDAILDSCITPWVVQVKDVVEGLKHFHPFFIKIAAAAPCWWENPGFSLGFKQLTPETVASTHSTAHWINRAKQFLATAKLMLLHKQAAMAAFLLHQSVEQAFTAGLVANTGYRVQTHNLRKLYQALIFYIPGLSGIFPEYNPKENCTLHYLQSAYIGSRYNDNNYMFRLEKLENILPQLTSLLSLLQNPCRHQHLQTITEAPVITPAYSGIAL
jgi:uncharacterized protein